MIIYIDLFFLINLGVDFLILTLSCGTEKVAFTKRFFGAFLGAIYACLICFRVPDFLFSFTVKLCVLFLMCAICFFPCKLKRYFIKTLTAFSISAFFSGLIYTLESFFQKKSIMPKQELLIALGISAAYALVKCFFSSTKKDAAKRRTTVLISYNGHSVSLSGIYDSANMLKEPVSGYPVIVADFSILEKLFPGIKSVNELCELVNVQDFKAIPYKTVSEHGIMYGFVPERLVINNRKISKAIIAAAPQKLEESVLLNSILI